MIAGKAVMVRYREANGELIVQTRSRGFCMSILVSFASLFFPNRSKEWFWDDYKPLDGLVYDIDRQLNDKASEIEVLLLERQECEQLLARERAELKSPGNKKATKGFTKPFPMLKSDFDKVKKIVQEEKVDQKWRGLGKVVQPNDKDLRKRMGMHRGPDDKMPGRRSAFTVEEMNNKFGYQFGQMAKEHGATYADGWKTNTDKVDYERNPQKKRKDLGETDEGHQARLKAMKQNNGRIPEGWKYF